MVNVIAAFLQHFSADADGREAQTSGAWSASLNRYRGMLRDDAAFLGLILLRCSACRLPKVVDAVTWVCTQIQSGANNTSELGYACVAVFQHSGYGTTPWGRAKGYYHTVSPFVRRHACYSLTGMFGCIWAPAGPGDPTERQLGLDLGFLGGR